MALTLPCNGLSLEGRILFQIKKTEWIDEFGALSDWNESDEDPCLWNGVHCTELPNFSRVVTEVNLTQTFIRGNLGSVICGLQNLRTLVLRWNEFGGPFPDGLLLCKRLEILDLSHNQFVGVLPSHIFELQELKYLDLSSAHFSGRIPPGFGLLTKIEVLHLASNLLHGTIPAFLGNLTSLVSLNLKSNPFAHGEIPEELGKLQRLRVLALTTCNLVGKVPSTLGNLSEMGYIDLGSNLLSGNIPESLMALPKMWQLVLTHNRLSGQIPSNVGKLKSMEILDLSQNLLSGRIPERIGNLTYLKRLLLFRNQFSGPIPPQLDQLRYLYDLRIFENKLTGLLPQNLGLNSKLLGLDASSNKLWGPIPQNLCKGGMFEALYVSSNNLSGTLPLSLASCRTLVALGVEKNRLSGKVPLDLWSSPKLQVLQLSDNSFEGLIPLEIANSNLSCLDITKNQFSGSIPAEIGQLRFLSILKASKNRLSGSIPEELTGLSLLSILLLDHNFLSLEIPKNIISWQALSALNLSNNQLSGSIPAALGSLQNLKIIDFSNNLLDGRIPLELGNLRPSVLNLSENQLCGPVPPILNNVAYKYSFLGNQGLCGGRALGLPDCILKAGEPWHMSIFFPGIPFSAAIICAILIFRLYYLTDTRVSKEKSSTLWNQVSFHGLRFNESEITKKLIENNVIGSGSSGTVYRVMLDSGEVVAVKKFCSNGRGKLGARAEKEFNAEVEMVGSRMRHNNVVKLLCCISSNEWKLLVYEFVPNGNLFDCLNGNGNGSSRELLQWPVRHKIAVSAARGLCYMHHECFPPILHRDIKSTNILLDAEFEAKIADFGVATILRKLGQEDSLSMVAGSYGYFAPEYAYTMKVNEKSDIYSFGVVLLELVTGKNPTQTPDSDIVTLIRKRICSDKRMEMLLDSRMDERYRADMLRMFRVALLCTATLPSRRPSMREVVDLLTMSSPVEWGSRSRLLQKSSTHL
eukprot:PITA_11749